MNSDAGVAVAEKVAAPAVGAAAQAAAQAAPNFQPWLMLIFALVVFSLVVLIRALPWSEYRTRSKPLSCDACMSFWVTLFFSLAVGWFFAAPWPWTLLHLSITPALSVLLLQWHRYLTVVDLPLPPFGPADYAAPTPKREPKVTAPHRYPHRK